MNHVYIEPKDCNCGDDPSCQICQGGLAVCKVCGLLEGGLTTDCPGVPSHDKGDEVYAGKLDYREGQGWVPEKNPINQQWEQLRKVKECAVTSNG